MSDNQFIENKVEEGLQLMSAHLELVEKQNELLCELLHRLGNLETQYSLSTYLIENANGKALSDKVGL